MGPKLSPTLKRPASPLTAPSALLAKTHWPISHTQHYTHLTKYVTHKLYYWETLIIFLKIVSGCCTGGQPAMWISRLACSTWLRRRHQRQILPSAPITLITIPLFACLQFNTIKKASRKMKSLYVTFHENVKMWK